VTVPDTAVEVLPGGPLRARFAAPGSKSVTNRLLAVAALAEGTSRLRHPLVSDDTAAMRRVVQGLGAQVTADADAWTVRGTGGRLKGGGVLEAGLSGTAMRFGVALAALAPSPVTVTGAPPLLRRPVGPLVAALRTLGAEVRDRDGRPPVEAGGGLEGGTVEVDVRASTQFASAILLIAPYTRRGVTLRATGGGAAAYVELTAATAAAWGARITEHGPGCWRVAPTHRYAAADVTVEHDASAAAHLLALAVATGGDVTVTNAGPTVQPDAGITAVFARMGATAARDGDAVTVSGPAAVAPVGGGIDLSAMPDQVTTVAALAALADGATRITGVAVTRGHETDRLAALAAELGKLGVGVEELPDGLVVHGGAARGPARLATHDDHRLAMAFAALAARVPGVVIEEPWCVRKTYPAFWADLRAAGVAWRPVS